MDKSEDLRRKSEKYWTDETEKIEDAITDHKTHTHSNEQFPLATKT